MESSKLVIAEKKKLEMEKKLAVIREATTVGKGTTTCGSGGWPESL